MVTFQEFMSIGMEKCAPSGPGTADARRETFAQLVDGWNEAEDRIRSMSAAEVRREIRCP